MVALDRAMRFWMRLSMPGRSARSLAPVGDPPHQPRSVIRKGGISPGMRLTSRSDNTIYGKSPGITLVTNRRQAAPAASMVRAGERSIRSIPRGSKSSMAFTSEECMRGEFAFVRLWEKESVVYWKENPSFMGEQGGFFGCRTAFCSWTATA